MTQKMIPKLRFPEFSDDWEVKKLGIEFDVRDGTHESPQYFDSGKPLVTSKNLKSNGTLDFSNISYISETDFVSINKRSGVDVGDILFGMIGTIGNPVRVQTNDFAIKNVALIKPKKVSTKYLIQYLNSPIITKQFYEKNTGGTQKFIALGDIRKLNIGLPTPDEQQKIADFLTTVDKKIESIDKRVELLKQYKKGVMQKIFTQQIRFKDDSGNDYPVWTNCELNKIADINPKQLKLPDSFVYIDLESVSQGKLLFERYIRIEEAPSRAQRVLQNNDILFQTVRPYQRNNLYFDLNGEYVASTGYAQIRAKKSPGFIYQLIHTDKFVNDVLDRCTGTSYPAINSNDLAKITICAPSSVSEQQKIADFLSAIDDKINAEETKLASAKKFKKALLRRMFV